MFGVIATAVAAAIALAGPLHADNAPVNLPVTDAVRDQLLLAAAALTDHPASDYTGLTPGSEHYAYDPILDTYWAAASLANGVGFGTAATMPPAGDCPVPPAIHDLWQLMPEFCHP
jgi:hypothetical protein